MCAGKPNAASRRSRLDFALRKLVTALLSTQHATMHQMVVLAPPSSLVVNALEGQAVCRGRRGEERAVPRVEEAWQLLPVEPSVPYEKRRPVM